jgi:hypothetical protein
MAECAAGSWFRVCLACAAASVIVTGCAPVLGGTDPRDGSRTGMGWKTVARKVEPNYLVAVDQTSCTVSSTRFDQIREGQRVLCNWRTNSPVSGALTPPHSLATSGVSGDYVRLSVHRLSRKSHGHPGRNHTAPLHQEVH